MIGRVATIGREVQQGMKGQSRPFYYVLATTLAIVALGMVMVASASSVDSLSSGTSAFAAFQKQSVAIVLGLLLMSLATLFGWPVIEKLAKLALVSGLAVQTLTVLTASSVKGNRNWLSFGSVVVQPSEFIKIALIAFLAARLAQLADPDVDESKTWWEIAIYAGASLALIAVAGSDMGTGIVIVLFVIGLLFVSGVSLRKLVPLIGVGIALAWMGLSFSPNRMSRFQVWLDPNAPDPLDLRWQFVHSTWALAEGGILGTGLGQSKLKWNWIPEVENDFIFAVVGEELGMLGAVTVIGLFLFLAVSLFRVAQAQTEFAAKLFVSGVMFWVLFQALVNIGVVLGLFPVLGVTLPLMSYGGSSMVATLIAIGMVLGVERNRKRGESRSVR